MQAEYLKASVGGVLSEGIAQTVLMRPEDPIDYLAQFLLKRVADDASAAAAQSAVKAEQKALEIKADAAVHQQREKKRQLTKDEAQRKLEDDELAAQLASAVLADEVFCAAVSYVRTRIGASSYLALTDLPDKDPTVQEAEGDTAGKAAAPEEAYGEDDGGNEAEKKADKPKFVPHRLKYVFATGADERVLLGRELARPVVPAEGEEEEEAAASTRGVGEGVSFDAIDTYMAGTQTVMHIPSAILNSSVKFYHIPRTGSFAVAPFVNADGQVKGVLSADTLGMDCAFTDAELTLLEQVATQLGQALDRVEVNLIEQHLKITQELVAAYNESQEDLAKQLEEAVAIEAEEGGDKLASSKARYRRAAEDLGRLEQDRLVYLFSRRTLSSEAFAVLRAVQAILVPALRLQLDTITWDAFKVCCKEAKAIWSNQLFSRCASFDVIEEKDAEGFAKAAALLPEDLDVEALKKQSFVCFLLLEWVRAGATLFEQKMAQEKAEAEAAAAAAEAAAAPAEQGDTAADEEDTEQG